MIKTGFKYKVYRPKNVSGNKTVFDVGHKDKEGNMHYLTIMCDAITIEDREEIKIVEINGLDQKFYNAKDGTQKLQITLYCKVQSLIENHEPKPNMPSPNEDFDTGPIIDISSDDLPF